MFDILITSGTVVDGSGAPRFRADVALQDGLIAAVGDLKNESARLRIDATDQVVAPGFIDSHCHSELSLVAKPIAESKARQGVTTEVLGNCGWSAYPLASATRDTITNFARPIFGSPEVEWAWSDLAGYYDNLSARSVGVNVATLVGHGNVRAAVLGFEDRKATADELEQMKALVQQAMDHGALGLSTGLSYPPGIYASTEELVELARVAGRNGGLYASHLRDQVDELVGSVQEALDIGRLANLPVLISHHKTCGLRNHGKVKFTLSMLEQARKSGTPTFSDMYPYLAGSSTIVMLLPPWMFNGGIEAMLARLRNRDLRARIAHDWEHGLPGWENRVAAVGWENVTVSHVATSKNRDIEGLSVAQGAAKRGKSTVDFFCELLVEERGEAGMILVNSCDEDMLMVLAHPNSMVGSDGIDVGAHPHPRQYGTFPKVLGELVREKKAMTLEAAVNKMSGFTAQTFGLPQIGLVRQGYHADITVFDPSTIKDVATYRDPRRFPKGIEWVIVGGVPSVALGNTTGDLNGRVLRRAK
jgi:N-acyl-D-aspartate/D-glutamate deacylase